MLPYYKEMFNGYTIRVNQIPSGSDYLALRLQDMTTQADYGVLFNPGQWSYDEYESFVSFSVNLDTTTNQAPVGNQFRATLTPAYVPSGSEFVAYNDDVWHGTFQFFQSQSLDKPNYINQIPLAEQYVSNVTDNDYIILD
jgi:hypothetical protein